MQAGLIEIEVSFFTEIRNQGNTIYLLLSSQLDLEGFSVKTRSSRNGPL